jgi:long-chain acyl-CoA synthetase
VDDSKDLSGLVAAVARFTTKGDPQQFEDFFLRHVEYMRAQEGFGSHQAVRLADDPSVYLNFGWWLSREAFLAVVGSEEFREHQSIMRSMLERGEVALCKNLYRVNATEEAGERGEFDTPLMTVTTYTVTGSAEEFEAAFLRYAKHVRGRRGFGYADLNRSMQNPETYYGIGYWWDPAAYDEVAAGPEFAALQQQATVVVERVTHVAWNRALGTQEEPAASAGRA